MYCYFFNFKLKALRFVYIKGLVTADFDVDAYLASETAVPAETEVGGEKAKAPTPLVRVATAVRAAEPTTVEPRETLPKTAAFVTTTIATLSPYLEAVGEKVCAESIDDADTSTVRTVSTGVARCTVSPDSDDSLDGNGDHDGNLDDRFKELQVDINSPEKMNCFLDCGSINFCTHGL